MEGRSLTRMWAKLNCRQGAPAALEMRVPVEYGLTPEVGRGSIGSLAPDLRHSATGGRVRWSNAHRESRGNLTTLMKRTLVGTARGSVRPCKFFWLSDGRLSKRYMVRSAL